MEAHLRNFQCARCEIVLKVDEEAKEPIGMSCGHNLCRECGDYFVSKGLEFANVCCRNSRIATQIDGKLELNLMNVDLMRVVHFSGRLLPRWRLLPTDCKRCCESLESSGDKVPMLLSCCGSTLCKSCLLKDVMTVAIDRDNQETSEQYQKITCPFCSEKITLESDFVSVNVVFQTILQRYEKAYDKCHIHPGKFKFFMCQEDGCDSELLCFHCTESGNHKGHRHSHTMKEAQELRQEIWETARKWKELEIQCQQDVQVFLNIADTFENHHQDYINLRNSIDKYYEGGADQGRRQSEHGQVSEMCVSTMEEMRQASQKRILMSAEAARKHREIMDLLVRSDMAMIKTQFQIRTALSNPELWYFMYPQCNFEAKRLGTWFIEREGAESELKQYYDVEVFVDNEEAEEVWGKFKDWLGTIGARRGMNPHIHSGGAIFDYETDKIRCHVVRPSSYSQQRPLNSCRFKNVFRVRTTSVFIQENNVHIDDKVFTDMNEASTILLDKIHWLLLED